MIQNDWWTFFWGTLLMLYGVSLLAKALFQIDIPILKIFFGCFFLYLGFVMLTGIDPFAVKSSQKYRDSYKVIFGQQPIDLRHYRPTGKPEKVAIEIMFGDAEVLLNKDIPTRITTSVAFGKVAFPNQESVVFGKETRVINGPLEDAYLDLYVKVRFGNLQFYT